MKLPNLRAEIAPYDKEKVMITVGEIHLFRDNSERTWLDVDELSEFIKQLKRLKKSLDK